MKMKYELGFIGAGNMAHAIATGLVKQSIYSAGQLIASDPTAGRRELFAGMGIATTEDNLQVVSQARCLMLAIKPQAFAMVGPTLAGLLRQDQVVISIMAGITTAKIAAGLSVDPSRPTPRRIVRVMPNTPLMVGLGMSGIAAGAAVQTSDLELTVRIFAAAGETIVVDESQLDAITAISGSGPAYLYYLAEAMEKAARQLGLGDQSPLLVRQTLLGASHLLCQSSDGPAELRRKVTSPGGTTEAALKHMDGNRTTDVIVNALKAAHQRSRELGA